MEKKMARPSDLRILEAEDRTPNSETPLGDQGTAGSFQINNTGKMLSIVCLLVGAYNIDKFKMPISQNVCQALYNANGRGKQLRSNVILQSSDSIVWLI